MDYSEILDRFSLSFKRICQEIEIPGSPERSLFRVLVEDTGDKLYIVEKINTRQKKHKKLIIDALNHLHRNGLSNIYPYVGNKLVETGDGLWQISPYVDNIALRRPGYIYDKWRGEAVASFMLDLQKAASNISFPRKPFSIKNYISSLMSVIEKNDEKIFSKLKRITDFLETSFLKEHDTLRTSFCHGDLHPLNILWGKASIKGVIDWEFLGYKPQLYDLANFTGCVGIEEPHSLTGDLVKSLVKKLKRENFAEEKSWRFFIELIVSTRFGWMSEWLRKDDKEMKELEIAYMNLLLKNESFIEEGLGYRET